MENNNKSSVLLTVLGVCTLLVALVGASFAYFTATGTTTEQDVQTGKLEIQSTLSATEENNIKPTNFNVSSADSNDDVAKFNFNVKGSGTTVTGGTYKIQLLGALTGVGQAENKGTNSDVKYALYKKGDTTKALASGDYTELTTQKTIDIENASLTSATNDDYTLYVYIEESDDNQDNLQNVTISATMNAIAQTPAPAGA